MLQRFGLTRVLIAAFILLLLLTAAVTGLPVGGLMNDSLYRIGMNLILVVALVPGIRGGVGLNFGLPLGIVAGVLGTVLAIENNFTGFGAFLFAVLISAPVAALAGWGYAWLLERVKGQEMMVGTYVGFAAVSLMSMVWLLVPFSHPEMVWAIGGKGLRTTIALAGSLGGALDKRLVFHIGDVAVPVGLFLFIGLITLIVSFYLRSSRGLAISAAGQNPLFAKTLGLSVSAQRTEAVIVSTVLAALGIVVYAQSFGFLQLYMAPLMMAFPAVASILIGGASLRHATCLHAVIGTVLFQTLLTISLPVAQRLIEGNISEVARVIISNGMIIYALTRPRTD